MMFLPCMPCLTRSAAAHFDEEQNPEEDALRKPTPAEYTGEAAKEFLNVLEAVAHEIPIPGVGEAVKIATNLIKACEEGHATLERAEALKLRIKTLVMVVVNQLKAKKIDEIRDKLVEDINALQRELKYIERKLDEIASQHNLLLIFFRGINEEKIQKCMDRLDGLLERFTIARQIDHANLLHSLEKEIAGFYDEQKKTFDHMHDMVESMNVTMEDVKAILKTKVGPSSPESNERAIIPANTGLFYGRDGLVAELVEHLTGAADCRQRHVCILGPGGMGKTCTALGVMANPDIQKQFPESIWVPCVKAKDMSSFFGVLASALGITAMTGKVVDSFLSALKSAGPLILLLDNFETPWNIDGGRSEVEQILREIDRIPHITLFVTMRSSIPPCKDLQWYSVGLRAIDANAARRLYSEIYPGGSADPQLSELLEIVGHMPLAITLMATSASLTGLSAKSLVEQYKKVGPTMLGHGSDAEHSMDVCISLSIDSPPMRRLPDARLLLAVLSMLPVGTTYEMLTTWWARDIANVTGALEVLRETSLVERRGSTFYVLPVIQSYVLHASRFPENVRVSMMKSACDFVERHLTAPGDESYKEDFTVLTAEECNLHSVLLKAQTPSSEIVNVLVGLSRFQASYRPCTNSIKHALKLVTKMEDSAAPHANVLSCYAAICHKLGRYQEARRHFIAARDMYLSISNAKQAAECLLGCVNTYRYDHSVDASTKKLLIAQAQSEFESIQNASGVALCWYHLGVTERKQGALREGLVWFHRAKDRFTEFGDVENSSRCSYEISLSHYLMDDFDQAKEWAKSAVEGFDELEHSEWDLDAALMLGLTLNARGEHAEMFKVFCRSLERSKAWGAPVHTGQALEQIGLAWLKMGKREDARAAFLEALQVYPDNPESGDRERCQLLLKGLEDLEAFPASQEREALGRIFPQISSRCQIP